MNAHNFNFKVGMRAVDSASLKMDGNELTGVTGFTIKAGANGYTNVAIEFEAPAAVCFVGHLMASLPNADDEEQALQLSAIWDDVSGKITDKWGLDRNNEIEFSIDAKADFVRLLITRCIEELGSTPNTLRIQP